MLGSPLDGGVASRARAWRNAAHAAVCDVIEPWAHGTVVRATPYPGYFDLNVVRVEAPVEMDVEELMAFADEALAGLEHRRVDFDLIEDANARRAGFEALGWSAMRLLWMRHEGGAPATSAIDVEEVPYEAVHELRVAWMQEEDRPATAAYHAQAREVALRRGARVLAVQEGGVPVAYAQLERDGPGAEIGQVYVRADRRGGGCGTAMTRAAIEAAGDARDLWISADDEERAKDLYARLGFRPAWKSMEFTRLP
jgi:GNAT superfamily N-acetyltransferase